MRKQLEDVKIRLEQTEKTLAITKNQHDKLHLEVGPEGDQPSRKVPAAPQTVTEELAIKLVSMRGVVADQKGLSFYYVDYQASVVVAGATPGPPELWISKVACTEIAKVQDALAKVLELAEGAATQRQRTEADASKVP